MSEPRWLPVSDVVAFNREAVARTGEHHRVREPGLLESAIGRAATQWHYAGERDLVVLACKLLMGIALNHPFEQGNKRTALSAAIAFLESNGCEVLDVQVDTTEALAEMIETAIVLRDEDGLVRGLRPFVDGRTLFSDDD